MHLTNLKASELGVISFRGARAFVDQFFRPDKGHH
jgi:hypothetical protein